ncbi:MAG: 5-methyltetrahydropteroyltriglutamate--homocysteine S-methyltransferase, partial [bacterium]
MSGRPPFRADVVGSLLRPPELRQARASAAAADTGGAELSALEDRLIAEAVRKQERIGLKAVSDGEFRRSWWHLDFFAGLEGTELVAGEGRRFHGIQTRSDSIVINGKVGWADHAMVGHFRYLARVAKVLPKMTISAPSVLHFRRGRNGISRHIYPDLDEFFSDTARASRRAVGAFYQAGC